MLFALELLRFIVLTLINYRLIMDKWVEVTIDIGLLPEILKRFWFRAIKALYIMSLFQKELRICNILD